MAGGGIDDKGEAVEDGEETGSVPGHPPPEGMGPPGYDYARRTNEWDDPDEISIGEASFWRESAVY